MSPDTTQILAGGALAIVIIDRVFSLIKPLIQKPGNGNGKSGDKDPAYWEMAFSRIVREELRNHANRGLEAIEEASASREQLHTQLKGLERAVAQATMEIIREIRQNR